MIAGLIRTLFFQPFWIPSGSMKPNLLIGDYIFVNKFVYGYSKYSCPFSLCPFSGRIFYTEPKRGDVVVFRHPVNGKDYVKRLIGLPGDEISIKDGRLIINGEKINDINLTTPAYEELFRYGSSNKKEKNIFIFEASSHALEQNRLRNYPINIAAITNISKDHLDYHKTFSNYKKSKIKLFSNHLVNSGFAIINSRLNILSELKKTLIEKNVKFKYFGNKNIKLIKINDFVYLNINNTKYKLENLKLKTNIELENLECAITCCLALNISQSKIIRVLSKVTNPSGRLQTIEYKKKKSKIIIKVFFYLKK